MKRSGPNRERAGTVDRRGIAVFWLLVWVPVLFALFCVVVDMALIWLARIELKNALEAAALAAVQEWGTDAGETATARDVGVDFANSNTILGNPLIITTNYDDTNPENQNLSCGGNLIFGGITNIDTGPPFVFDTAADAGCNRVGQVLIEICKANAGASKNAQPRMLGIFYEDGDADLSIRSVSLTVDDILGGSNQQPYFDGDASESPEVSDYDFADPGGPNPLNAPCRGNRNTPDGMGGFTGNTNPAAGTVITTNDVFGGPNVVGPPFNLPIDPDPQTNGTWDCLSDPPDPANWAATGNDRGDICFGFADPVNFGTDRFRTITIYFRDGVFNPPQPPPIIGPPSPVEFVRYAFSMNQFNPPALPGVQNDGNAFAGNVTATITFVDQATPPNEFVCTARFVDGGADRSIAICNRSSGGGNAPAVRAQATTQVKSIWSFCGLKVGPYDITSKSTAVLDCETEQPRLIYIDPENYNCSIP